MNKLFIILYFVSLVSGLMRHFGPKTSKNESLWDYFWKIMASITPVANLLQLLIGVLVIIVNRLSNAFPLFLEWLKENGENEAYNETIDVFTNYPWYIEKGIGLMIILPFELIGLSKTLIRWMKRVKI